MTEQLDERGFTCECGRYHKYPAYVIAHWNEVLIHTCPNCYRKHEICEGVAIPTVKSNLEAVK